MEYKKAPHIGQMIRAHVKKRRLFQSGWARMTGKHYSTIVQYQKVESMRVDTLFDICQELKHNFLQEITDALPAELQRDTSHIRQEEVDALQKQVQQLQTQVATLKEALMLIGGKGI